MSMSWRFASRLSVITLALLVVLLVAFWSLHNSVGETPSSNPNASQSGLQGTDLDSVPAPDFRLSDQFGKPISLSQFEGRPVVLTFLYTHCPDVCPLTANKLHTTMQNLGKDAQHVTILAVSMDPKGDTPADAQNFSRVHKLGNYFHFLLGAQDQLAPVWASYSVDAQAATSTNVVSHSSAIYVIDKDGRERVLFDSSFDPNQLSADLKTLLGE